MWLIVISLVIVAATTLYLYVHYKMKFWKQLGVPQDDGTFPFGSSTSWDLYLLKKAYNQETITLYNKYRDHQFVGVYHMLGQPKLTILDLELAKQVLIKDFDSFTDRLPEGYDFCAPNSKRNKYWANTLLTLKGEKWKNMRASLSPIFTSGKLKGMVDLIHRATDDLIKHFQSHCCENIEVKDLMRDFGIDVIASTGFGIENSTFNNPSNPVKKNAFKIMGNDTNWKLMFTFFFISVFPSLQRWLDLPLTNQDAMEFFATIIRESIKERKNEKIRRNDFIDLLVDVLTKKQDCDGESTAKAKKIWNDEEIEDVVISNALLLFLAGFDTTSSASSLMFYYLAKNPEIQDKLLSEVTLAIQEHGNEKLSYDMVMKLPYLDMVFHETLRIYNIGSHLERATTKAYKIPNTDIIIPKGIHVNIAVPAIMKDEKYFPNPDVFNPENFSAEAKSSRSPYAFAGFGHGPRNCIGMRFALLQVKIALSRIVFNFKIVPCEKTAEQLIPHPTSQSFLPKDGIYVAFEKR